MSAADNDAGADLRAHLVAEEVRRLLVAEEARAIVAARAHPAVPFDIGTLAEMMQRPSPPRARVDGLIPWAASTLLVAQRKAGKTTLVLNLARCLLTGEPFLGSRDVRPLARGATVGFLNYEVDGAQLARWAHEVGIPAGRFVIVNLRGRRSPLHQAADGARLARLLRDRGVETLIVDPFGRAYSGASQNDAGEVGAWLVNLDRFARDQVGATDLVLTAHAGWNGERSRGSSALEDWADAVITVTRGEESGERFLRAIGRDVDFAEDRLDFDLATRSLRLSGAGSRSVASTRRDDADTQTQILGALTEHADGMSGKELADHLGRKDAGVTKARDGLVTSGQIVREARTGKGGGWRYRLGNGEGTEHAEQPTERTFPNLPNLPFRGSVGRLQVSDPKVPSCAKCGQPLHATAIADGFITCPACEVVG